MQSAPSWLVFEGVDLVPHRLDWKLVQIPHCHASCPLGMGLSVRGLFCFSSFS
ncbi:hypothetical protein MtrunA17_Chr8g0391171 [Medicago truncatula]|uniref:Uncharacterized protein n=1 Tax=Medicago truncatula TaxID=3880 RepID=A0A396GRI2_MEDTR|nr:hypothetical protein MtrunA17_Chr8g0391171 [Medicago truncatula]